MPRFTMTHSRGDMARLAEWLDRQEGAMAMPAKVANAVRQCLEEAVANLIDHTPPVADETISVELNWQGGTLEATLEDQGPPFDPRNAPPMVRATSLETVEPGGWGIHLIRAFASDIAYETNGGRNRLRLRFAPQVAQSAAIPTAAC
jgi:anti-sigma regulatory factor (Ser/Thr protein kinase)